MKKIFLAAVALAVLASLTSSAQAITATASIKKGVASVQGKGAAANSSIWWEGVKVATANKKGVFKFSAPAPVECMGEVSDGVTSIDVAVSGCTPAGAVLETGQTTCYDDVGAVINCASTGQDGEVQKGRTRSYRVSADGLTIMDNTTGLEWEKLTNDWSIHGVYTTYTWAQAFQKIADLNAANFAGHDDWRLPNVNELLTLVHYGQIDPAIDAPFTTGNDGTGDSFTAGFKYWSSTTYVGGPNAAWWVHFFAGGVGTEYKIAGFGVRAVRSGF
jgi:uncharacterized protein DUF1566